MRSSSFFWQAEAIFQRGQHCTASSWCLLKNLELSDRCTGLQFACTYNFLLLMISQSAEVAPRQSSLLRLKALAMFALTSCRVRSTQRRSNNALMPLGRRSLAHSVHCFQAIDLVVVSMHTRQLMLFSFHRHGSHEACCLLFAKVYFQPCKITENIRKNARKWRK